MLLGFARQMARRFTDVDMVVTGHLHLSFDHVVDGVRHFSPGAVFVNEMLERARRRASGPIPWAYRRYRKGIDDADRLPAIGLVEAGPRGLTARRIVLERPIRRAAPAAEAAAVTSAARPPRRGPPRRASASSAAPACRT